MGHLSSERLIDLAEGLEVEPSFPHLQSCEDCRQRLADLRATMSAAAEVDVPEPSPLFWDHLSARVRDAVESESAAQPASGRWSWLIGRPVWAGAFALMVVAVVFLARSGRTPDPPPVASSTTSRVAIEEANAFDDPSLSLVLDLAGELDWDGAREAGLTTHVGVDNDAWTQLSEGERQELQELLKGEMANRGA